MAKAKSIEILNRYGQSAWYDNLSRDVLQKGELQRLINLGISGLTSNPSIFKSAIADSTDYDADIRLLAGRGLSEEQICEELMLEDVRHAADLLRPVYEESEGTDGYASVEVSPLLAYDVQQTLEQARRIWGAISRPNLMIKVPATQEGLVAIRTLLEEGINVNVTLIFSVEVYRTVMDAYLSALESRRQRGESVAGIASVASFFVSRVDEICERELSKLKNISMEPFFGEVAVANSKMAYALYQDYFTSERFFSLKKYGAKVQRPLWASTGTKNPKLPPLVYVNALAGRDTVNTLKPETLAVLLETEDLSPALHEGLDRARDLLAALGRMGVDLNTCMKELEEAGVKAFADAYRVLLESIRRKVRALT